MKKYISTIWLISIFVVFLSARNLTYAQDINTKVSQLDTNNANLDDVIRIFGEPEKYLWSGKTFTKDNLPSIYIASYYSNSLHIVIGGGKIIELRFQTQDTGYVYQDKLKIGSSLDEVIELLGNPTETVHGKPNKFKDAVLYRDIDGRKGLCYYGRADKNVRLFFANYNVTALYLTRDKPAAPKSDSSGLMSAKDINTKVSQLDINTANLDDVIRIFGEPEKYLWSGKTFTKDNLPSIYIAAYYSNSLYIAMSRGEIIELRFQRQDTGYVYQDKLKIGSSLDEVIKVVGQPKEVVQGQALPRTAQDGVLYKDINGRKGYCYYGRRDHGVRFFFLNYNVTALYVTRTKPAEAKGGSFQTVRPVTSVEQFDDVRWKDMSKLDLSGKKGLIPTLRFNQKTVWPKPAKMPPGNKPDKVLKDGMNPGLDIRRLHRQGITGKGVNVAIIDQPLYQDHPEFTGKIVAYHDVGCGTESSMHGPAVASLLVGKNCGTAPDARLYYAAAPSWTKDTAYQAQALNWIIEQNEKLPASKKIRVVSVSAAPSGLGSPFDKNQQMWDKACALAEAENILVLDCTAHHGFISPCWYNRSTPESVIRCTPGYPGREPRTYTGRILVPTSPRTTAEEFDKADFSYQYCSRGGLSWAIPYCAGVLALGWQIRPEIGPEQMRDLLFKSAYIHKSGDRIINPNGFIRLVRKAKVAPGTRKK